MATRELLTLDESQPRVVSPQTGDTFLAPRLLQLQPETLTSGGTDDYSFEVTQTLNDPGAAGGTDYYSAIKVDVTATDVTGWDSTYLIDLQVGSSSVFAVDFSGNVTVSGLVDGVDIATIGAASHAAVTLSGTGTYLTLVGQDIQVDPITESDISDLGTLTAMVADNLSVFAATTSAQLAGVINDETGSGSLVFATSPTLVTPALGTPSSGTLTNCTGYAASDLTESQISDLGTTVALVADNLSVFAATTSAQLAGVINDETGSGSLVFATSPTLVTPVLGTPTSGTLTNCDGYLGDSSLVTSGALNSGSITSGFGNIDIGASTFTTTGTSTMGVLDADGLNVDASGLETHTAQTGITAYAGGGQANATQITSSYAVVSTVGTAADSVKLPTAAAGLKVTVFNEAATNALDLFPSSSDNIDGAGVDTAVSIAAGNNATYFAIDATNWRQI